MINQPTKYIPLENLENGIVDDVYMGMLRQSLKVHSSAICTIIMDFNRNVYTSVSADVFNLECNRNYLGLEKPLFDSIPFEEYCRMIKRSKVTHSFVSGMSAVSDMTSLSVVEDFHIRVNGKEILVTQRFVPLNVNNDGKITVGLLVVMPSANSTFGELVVLCENRLWKYNEITQSFMEEQKVYVSDSEKELLLLSKSGMPVKDIARQLCLSENTIKTKRKRLFKKLGVVSLMAAICKMDNYSLW